MSRPAGPPIEVASPAPRRGRAWGALRSTAGCDTSPGSRMRSCLLTQNMEKLRAIRARLRREISQQLVTELADLELQDAGEEHAHPTEDCVPDAELAGRRSPAMKLPPGSRAALGRMKRHTIYRRIYSRFVKRETALFRKKRDSPFDCRKENGTGFLAGISVKTSLRSAAGELCS